MVNTRSRIGVGLAAAALLVSMPAQALTHVWNSSVTNGNWNAIGSWSSGGVPASGEMGDRVVQIGGGVTATDNIAGLVIDRLVFTDGGNTVAGSGVTLTLNTPPFPTNLESITGNNTIASSLPIVFSGGFPCGVVVDAGTLTLASNVSGQGFILQALSAAGTLTLTGSNSFGPVTVRAGVVILASSTPNVAMPSSVVIGDGSGGPGSAVVASDLADQIADGAAVTILSDGRLDLSFAETIASLNMTGGLVASVTGTGSLAVGGGGVTATSDSIPLPASILVNMTLTSFSTLFTVNPGLGSIQLDVSGALSGLGLQKEGAGTLQLSGSQANVIGSGTRVNDGTLLLNKTPGVNAVGAGLTIGSASGVGTQTVRLGANQQMADTIGVGVSGSGVLDLNGHLETLKDLTLSSDTSSGSQIMTGGGTLTLNGNVTVIQGGLGTVGASISGNLDLGTGTHTFMIANGPAAADLTVSAVISGGGGTGITKDGGGTMVISSASTYIGPTTVNGGRLLVDGSIAGSGVLVDFGGNGSGTIGGVGTVHGIYATMYGAVAPGDSPGILSSNLPVTFQPGAKFNVELNGLTAGAQYDQLNVAGSVTLGGIGGPALSVSVGFPASMGNTFTIIQATGPIMGTFSGLSEGATLCANGYTLQIHYTSTTVTLTVIATSDTTNPVVTAPVAATVTQTVCQ